MSLQFRIARVVLTVLATAALAAGCRHSDSTLRAAALAQLAVNPATSAATLDVVVTGGTARISGETLSREQQRTAVEIVRVIDGISDVVDEMRLGDAIVRETVKRALAEDPVVGRIPIDVDVSEGVVYLTSSATGPDDRRLAVALASQVDGVLRVEDWMK